MRLDPRRAASTLEALESRVLMARAEGVDVSLYQGDINWNTMASRGKQFAFIRSSRTNLTKDDHFDANVAGSTAAGLTVGAYHFCLPNGLNEAGPETDPVADAQKFYAAGKSAMGTGFIRPVMDVEAGTSLGKTELSNWVLAFSNELQRLAGVKPLIYCSTSYATTYLDTRVSANNDLWIARWNNNNAGTLDPQAAQPETPSGYPNSFGSWNVPLGGAPDNSAWDFWQYTSNGDGVFYGASSTRLDMDVYNGDINSLKQNFMIGYQKAFVGPLVVATGATTVIQAENYDVGGEGVSYHDTTPTSNTGNVYRTSVREGVDLAGVPNTANYRITDALPGEWTEYTVDVNQAGTYRLDLGLSQTEPNAKVHVALDGGATDLTGPLTVPDTNNFNAFAATGKNVTLPAGRHVLRISFDTAAINGVVAGVDWLKISPPTVTSATIKSSVASYVRGGTYAGTNFGQSSEIDVKKSGSTTNTREGYIKFDLSSVSAINSAKLRLYGRLSSTVNPSLQTLIYNASNTSWTENGITNSNKPASGSTLRGSLTVGGTTAKWYEVDLTSFLKSEFAAGRKVVTLVLKNSATSDSYSIFSSDETANGPQLVVS